MKLKEYFVKYKYWLFLIAVSIVIGYGVFNENGLWKYYMLKDEVEELRYEIKSAKNELKSIKSNIDSLKVSKSKIEKYAREKYQMKKPDEEGFRIEER